MNMNFFTGIFVVFCLLFRSTHLKEHLCVVASVFFNREASQGSAYFLEKYYSWSYLNMKIPDSKLGGSTYLLINKYWWSGHFLVNN